MCTAGPDRFFPKKTASLNCSQRTFCGGSSSSSSSSSRGGGGGGSNNYTSGSSSYGFPISIQKFQAQNRLLREFVSSRQDVPTLIAGTQLLQSQGL